MADCGDPTHVALVVPMRNETGSLHRLVASIRAQSRHPDEVILVDGGSTDGTAEMARGLTEADPRYRVLEIGPATPGRGRNCGVAATSCPWIAFTDAGIHLHPRWVERLLERAAREDGPDVVYGHYAPVTDTLFRRCAALAYVAPESRRPEGTLRAPSIASSLLRRTVWQQVGGFPDERAAEDLLFMEAVAGQGFRVAWAPEARVSWEISPGFRSTFARFRLYSLHNARLGRQRDWHYGVARQYALLLPLLALSTFHLLWLLALPLWLAARSLKSIWCRRAGRGMLWAANPVQLALVAVILLTLDAATFAGWLQARTRPDARPPGGRRAADLG